MNTPPPRRFEAFTAFNVTVLWAAVTFAAWGVMSWLLNRDPVTTAVDRSYGIITIALAGVAVWLVCAATAHSAHPWWGVIGAAAAVYLVAVAAAIPYALGLVVEQSASPFVIAAVALAGGAVVLCWILVRRRAH